MTMFAQDRAAFESFLDCVQGGAGKDAIAGCLAENVVLSRSKTPWSTEWTTPCWTRTARSPR
jgi:hypothetical protein